MSTFWQSSEIGYGAEGRERALRFRDEAQAAMDASFNAGWIDETLAQAAWVRSHHKAFRIYTDLCYIASRSFRSLCASLSLFCTFNVFNGYA